MRSRSKLGAALMAMALTACGGGGSEGNGGMTIAPVGVLAPTPTTASVAEPTTTPQQPQSADCSVSLWGDSILYGGSGDPTFRLAKSPATAIKSLRPTYTVSDHSFDGASAFLHANLMLNDQLAQRIVVLEYGMNDAGNKFPYEPNMRAMIKYAKSKSRAVIITGLSHMRPDSDNRNAYNAIAESLAKEYSVEYANWDAVAFDPTQMLDGVHPDQTYSLRLANQIVHTMDRIAPECASPSQ